MTIKVVIIGHPKQPLLHLLEPHIINGDIVLVDVEDCEPSDSILVLPNDQSEKWHLEYELAVGRVIGRPHSEYWEKEMESALERGLLRHAELEAFLNMSKRRGILDVVQKEALTFNLKATPRFEEPFLDTPSKGYHKPTPFFQPTGTLNCHKAAQSFAKAKSKRKRKI